MSHLYERIVSLEMVEHAGIRNLPKSVLLGKMYRLFDLFLAWSWRVGVQGTSACYLVLAHKNLDSFDRALSMAPPSQPTPLLRHDRIRGDVVT